MKSFIWSVAVLVTAVSLGFGDADYTCESPKWAEKSGVTGDLFTGSLSARCTFKGTGSGDFGDVVRALTKQLLEGAEEVHAGPTETSFAGIPSVLIDMTDSYESQGMKAKIRSDVNLATDETTHLIIDSKSTKVTGEGLSKGLKKLDVNIDVTLGEEAGYYVADVETLMEVKKPIFIDTKTFEKAVRDGAVKELEAQEAKQIPPIAAELD